MSDDDAKVKQKITLPEVIELANQAAESSMGPGIDKWDDLFAHQKQYYLERYEIEGLEDAGIDPVPETGSYDLKNSERVVPARTSAKMGKIRKAAPREIEVPFRAGDVVRCKSDGAKYIIYEINIDSGSWWYSTHETTWHCHEDLTLIRQCDQKSLKKLMSCRGDDR